MSLLSLGATRSLHSAEIANQHDGRMNPGLVQSFFQDGVLSKMAHTVINPELFKALSAEVSAFIKKKLKSMEIEVTDLKPHKS